MLNLRKQDPTGPCACDVTFAAAQVSAASSGTGTPGESPVKENKAERFKLAKLPIRMLI